MRHPTYGQSLDVELKVRKTVDYLAANINVVCVINTTGTPYFQRQPLKDVVIWYGLSQGIKDDILKDFGNIQAYDFSGDAKTYVAHVIKDFFKDYGDVARFQTWSQAKLAMYFPQTNDLKN